MDHLLNGLNNAQKDAVTSPSPVLQVLAPPGSGKTKTLTARVAYLLIHHGYAPWNIICCTFTIKASREMRERLRGLIGDKLESKLILGTFHSICRRYLVTYGNKIGLQKGFGIADSSDSLAIIKRIVKRLQLSIEPSAARSRISHQKAQGGHPNELDAGRKRTLNQQEFWTVFAEYEAELVMSNLLDYDDLLLRCLQLLRDHPECVSNIEAVLIDEFQDTNTVQFELMKRFASAQKRITIVGDPDQSIYGFRSAEIKNLTLMRQYYPDTTVINLEENYRSSAAILSSAQDVIEQDISRPNKRLKPTHQYGTLPTFRKLPSAVAEASWLVLEIQRAKAMTGRMLEFSDFAILLRSAALSRLIESAMGKAGIPYKMVGGSRFFDRKEIRILLDYLRTICQPQNNDAFMAVINVPSRKIGDQTIKSLVEEAQEKKVSLFTYVHAIVQRKRKPKKQLMKAAEQNLAALVSLIQSSKEKLKIAEPRHAPKILLEHIIKKLSFKEYLEKTFPEDEENRWANVEELLAQAEDMSTLPTTADSEELPLIEGVEQQINDGGEEALSRFLANISLSSEIQSDDDGSQQKVTISTIHAAKGLEWPVVFIPAVYQGSIPHSRAEDTDEERRLLYVAMTRAQALLYLSLPMRQSRDNEGTTCSTFIRQRALSRYFQDAGPTFDDLLVKSVAHTLRRGLPSEETIVEEMQKLRSISDDLWPLDGTPGEQECRRREEQQSGSADTWFTTTLQAQDAGAATSGGGGFYQSFPAASTMDQALSFSRPGNGFTTASHHLQHNVAVDVSQVEQGERHALPKIDKSSKEFQKEACQSSIANFFSSSSSSKSLKALQPSNPKPQVPRSVYPNHSGFRPIPTAHSSIITTENTLPDLPANANPTLPQHLINRRLPNASSALTAGFKRPRPLTDVEPNTKRRHEVLHSSSPPPEQQYTDGDESNEGKKTEEAEGAGYGGYKPVQTMLAGGTTMSHLQQNGGRKTLGVRRTFNGWADRMNR